MSLELPYLRLLELLLRGISQGMENSLTAHLPRLSTELRLPGICHCDKLGTNGAVITTKAAQEQARAAAEAVADLRTHQ